MRVLISEAHTYKKHQKKKKKKVGEQSVKFIEKGNQ